MFTEVTLSATARLRQARAALVISQPFFGTLALYLELVEATRYPDGRPCETMGTDGRRLYFNPRYVDSLSDLELQGVIAHEVEHCARFHHTRRGARDRLIWNQATDYAINGGLVRAGFKLPGDVLLDASGEFDGLNAEGIFAVLSRHQLPEPSADGETDDSGEPDAGDGEEGGDESDASGDGSGESDASDDGAGDPGEGEEGDGAGDGPETADPAGDGASGHASGTGAPSVDQRNCDPGACGEVLDAAPDFDPAEAAANEAEWQARVQVALAVAKAAGAGMLPGHLQSIADELIAPRVDPAETFRRFVDQSATRDYSWTRPSRRFVASGLYLPGTVAVRPAHIVALVDTSVSITKEERDKFAGFLQEALDAGAADRLTVAYADTEIQAVREYEPGDTLELDSPLGGGTAFRQPLAWTEAEIPDVSAIAYLTDCDPSDWGAEPSVPLLWLVTGDPRRAKEYSGRAPFGESVLLDVHA